MSCARNLPVRPPEIELLLSCARAAVGSPVSLPEPLEDRFGWNRFLDLSTRHGMLPLVCTGLDRVQGNGAFESLRRLLRPYWAAHVRRNAALTSELFCVLNGLDEQGINVIPFKGPVLAVVAYGDVSLRPFGDLDLVVPRRDVDRTLAVLADAGYRLVTPDDRGTLARGTNACTLRSASTGTDVDLHWAFTPDFFPFDLDPEEVLGRLVPVRIAGQTLRGLATGDLILALCAHASKHAWARLEWVFSLSRILESLAPADWPGLRARARGLGGERMLLVGLVLAHDLFGTPLPESLRATLASDVRATSLAAEVEERLSSEPEHPFPMSRFAFALRVRERYRDRLPYLRFLARRFLVPNALDREAIRLPHGLGGFHYVHRFWRLGRRAISSRVPNSLPKG